MASRNNGLAIKALFVPPNKGDKKKKKKKKKTKSLRYQPQKKKAKEKIMKQKNQNLPTLLIAGAPLMPGLPLSK